MLYYFLLVLLLQVISTFSAITNPQPKYCVKNYVDTGVRQDVYNVYVDALRNKTVRENYVYKVSRTVSEISCYRYYVSLLGITQLPECEITNGSVRVKELCKDDCEELKTSPCYTFYKHVTDIKKFVEDTKCEGLQNDYCQKPESPSKAFLFKHQCAKQVKPKDIETNKLNKFTVNSVDGDAEIIEKATRLTFPSMKNYKCDNVSKSYRQFFKRPVYKQLLPHLKPINIKPCRTLKYVCGYQLGRDIKKLSSPIGRMRYYKLDDSMVLNDVIFSIMQKSLTVYTQANGVYDICGTKFVYEIVPVVATTPTIHFHGSSDQNISALAIALYENMRKMPKQDMSAYLLKYNFLNKEFRNVMIAPNMDVFWFGDSKKITMFQGIGTSHSTIDLFDSSEWEIIIGDKQRFTVLWAKLDSPHMYKVEKILNNLLFAISYLVPEVSLTNFNVDDMEIMFSTGDIDIPELSFLNKCNEYKSVQWLKKKKTMHIDEFERGLYIKAFGEMSGVMDTFIFDNTAFTFTLNTRSGNTKILLQFTVPADMDCQKKRKEQEVHWKAFDEMLKDIEKNAKVKTKKKKQSCRDCCEGLRHLVSLRFERESEFILDSLEIRARILTKEEKIDIKIKMSYNTLFLYGLVSKNFPHFLQFSG